MVAKKEVYRDLDDICRLTNSWYGNYNELCQYDENGMPLKMAQFLQQAEERLGAEYKIHLLNAGIIVMAPGGGYDFNFGISTCAGGGDTYAEVGKRGNGSFFMFFGDKNDTDKHNMYHEAAHTLQQEFNYFNCDKLTKVYNFCSKGMPHIAKKDRLPRLFADAYSYTRYLHEVHAEAFAAACMILHADNEKEFARQCRKELAGSGYLSYSGLKDKNVTYPSNKYYFSFTVQKALIAQLRDEYRCGETGKYFDGNGRINFRFLAEELEKLVLEYGLSPRTFLHLLQNQWRAKHYDFEESWQHVVPVLPFWKKVCRSYYRDTRQSDNLALKQYIKWQKRTIPSYQKLPEVDTDICLLNTVCAVNEAYLKLDSGLKSIAVFAEDYAELDPQLAVRHCGFPAAVQDAAFLKLCDEMPDECVFVAKLLKKYRQRINAVDFSRVDTETVCTILAKMQSPSGHEKVWELARRKADEPWLDIHLQAFGRQPDKKKKDRRHQSYALFFKLRHYLFCRIKMDDEKLQSELRQDIVAAICSDPEKLTDSEWRLELGRRYLPAVNKQNRPETVKNLNKGLNEIYFLYYKNPQAFKEMTAARGSYILPQPRQKPPLWRQMPIEYQ